MTRPSNGTLVGSAAAVLAIAGWLFAPRGANESRLNAVEEDVKVLKRESAEHTSFAVSQNQRNDVAEALLTQNSADIEEIRAQVSNKIDRSDLDDENSALSKKILASANKAAEDKLAILMGGGGGQPPHHPVPPPSPPMEDPALKSRLDALEARMAGVLPRFQKQEPQYFQGCTIVCIQDKAPSPGEPTWYRWVTRPGGQVTLEGWYSVPCYCGKCRSQCVWREYAKQPPQGFPSR